MVAGESRYCVPCALAGQFEQRVKSSASSGALVPSTRTNLSPFTKDFRGGEQVNESID